jgi:predicted NUDIX family NTP pyrophosphohydrolase
MIPSLSLETGGTPFVEDGVAKRSAGLLLYRKRGESFELFLVHPGGPFWAKKDLGAWSIPKGEFGEGEEPLDAARREFMEETGFAAPANAVALGEIKQAGGKIVVAWAAEGDCDPNGLVSNVCSIEWPPLSVKMIEIPEVDRGAWFSFDAARERILKSQQPFLERLAWLMEASGRG